MSNTFLTADLKKKSSSYFDFAYFIKFIVLLLVLYYFNVCYIAIVDHQGMVYSSFLDHYFNYIVWVRNSILYTSNAFLHALGINSYINAPYQLRIPHGPAVETVYACLGLGLMSFWVAFVSVDKNSWKKKIAWIFIGLACIWFINCWRIALLLIALMHKTNINSYLDHHTLFNIFAYSLIGVLMHFYVKATNSSLS